MKKKIKLIKSYLRKVPIFWKPIFISIIAILLYSGTIGFFSHLEYLSNLAQADKPSGASWLTYFTGGLASIYAIALCKKTFGVLNSKPSDDDLPLEACLTLCMFGPIILIVLTFCVLGGGIMLPVLFVPGYWDWLNESDPGVRGLSPEFAWKSILSILGSSIFVGVIAQLINTLLKSAKRRKKPSNL